MGGNWTSHDFFRVKLEKTAGISLLRMPYQGGAPAVQAVAGNNCDASTPFVPEGLSSVDGKLVTPLAVSSAERNPAVKNVPTCRELGLDVVQVMWRCIVMPLKTPEPVLETLEKVFYQTYQNPEFQATLQKAGGTPIWMDRKQFNKYAEEEYATYAKLIKEFGIQAK
ncbi:MAG: hypothetical protein C4530_18320 [Desulfobacteraceae bacterium]|nr:MAG: hypothetical protein C4530_18320 [Desulfobacteraceae bacterium]